jgi:MFS family permease
MEQALTNLNEHKTKHKLKFLIEARLRRSKDILSSTYFVVATALIPLADSISFWAFLVARALQGVAFASIFPLSGLIIHDWAPLKEHGLFISLLTGCTQLSNIFTMPISG